jgi:hypothetical protein
MKRRKFLKALAAIPLVGAPIKALIDAQPDPAKDGKALFLRTANEPRVYTVIHPFAEDGLVYLDREFPCEESDKGKTLELLPVGWSESERAWPFLTVLLPCAIRMIHARSPGQPTIYGYKAYRPHPGFELEPGDQLIAFALSENLC